MMLYALTSQIERRYVEVPFGANSVEAIRRTSEFDTTWRFFVDGVQVQLSLSNLFTSL